ncbi:MAG: hypothetical protein RI996_113 [Candidatus Parcubacteria bacterium]|jgi:mannosyltransferase OCH1-like enzyme
MIPKKIHFIWLGNSKKPKSFVLSLDSIKKHAPAYEVQIWDESAEKEFDLPEYYFRAKKEKKWAFASDILRAHILHRYGGIYFDTDQILLKPLQEDFLEQEFFTATYHNKNDYYGFQLVGTIATHFVMRKIIDFYDSYTDSRYIIVNKVLSDIINTLTDKERKSLTIYPQEYFYPLTEKDRTDNTYAYHLGNTSWIPWWKKAIHMIPGYIHIQKMIKKTLPKSIRDRIYTIEYL